ncbi:MAG: methyltransferase domain-containing protein [Proteobacteria bacterium]|nr:methyltransferase domain-containing protein [Pseudomonadota bacterium]
MGTSLATSSHFDRVASNYARVRNTDPDVIETITENLPTTDGSIYIADIGCGTGRYTAILVKKLDRDLRLFCCDSSSAMLAECNRSMNRRFSSAEILFCKVCANSLPFSDGSLDAVVTFNAIHHFNLDRFVGGASRVLRPGGLLSIYTRTPEQNARTVWGQHFPGFSAHETRLHCCKRIEEAIDCASGLHVAGVEVFKFWRTESRQSLLNRARNFHYSTFVLYPREEFRRSMAVFARKLERMAESLIEHTAENTLVLARRT